MIDDAAGRVTDPAKLISVDRHQPAVKYGSLKLENYRILSLKVWQILGRNFLYMKCVCHPLALFPFVVGERRVIWLN